MLFTSIKANSTREHLLPSTEHKSIFSRNLLLVQCFPVPGVVWQAFQQPLKGAFQLLLQSNHTTEPFLYSYNNPLPFQNGVTALCVASIIYFIEQEKLLLVML